MEKIHLEKQGETLTFLTPDDQTADKLEMYLEIAPGKSGPTPHIHCLSDEGFEVKSGTLIVLIDGKESILRSGDKIIVKAGQVHSFRNGSDEEAALVNGYIDPAYNFKWMLVEMAKSANERGGSWDNVSLILAGYVLFLLRKEYRLGGIPFFIQDILFGILSLTAKLTGKWKTLPQRPVLTYKN